MTVSAPEAAAQGKRRLRLALGVFGKHRYRIRERHIADHLAPLITARAHGAAKLDLILRCIALSPQHTGKREAGFVLPACSWEHLHDLARGEEHLGVVAPGMDPPPAILKLKRKWVGQQLDRLEARSLVRREKRPGRRPALLVLRDDASGKPLDDPDGSNGNEYVTILGALLAKRILAGWGAPELAAYLAASVAEGHESSEMRRKEGVGLGSWYRPLPWFADTEKLYGPQNRVRIPFSVPTLERGIKELEGTGLISHQRILKDPRTGKRLRGPRNLYTNRFGAVDASALMVEGNDEGVDEAD